MARPKLGDSETERLHIKITADEVSQIDDWRYENRVPSRSEAVRRLVQMALAFDRNREPLIEAVRAVAASSKALNEDILGYFKKMDPDELIEDSPFLRIINSMMENQGAAINVTVTFSATIRPINTIRGHEGTFGDIMKASAETEKFFTELTQRSAKLGRDQES